MSQLGNGKHLLDRLIRGLLWQNSTHMENISNCEQTWILSCVRSIVNRLMSFHDRWVCFGPWFHVGYIHVLEIKANFSDHVFSLSEPNTVAKALLQDFRDFRRPEPKSYSAALGASTAQSCWRQWGSGAKSHVSSRRYSGYHVRRFLSQWYHSVSLCHCAVVERVNPKVLWDSTWSWCHSDNLTTVLPVRFKIQIKGTTDLGKFQYSKI